MVTMRVAIEKSKWWSGSDEDEYRVLYGAVDSSYINGHTDIMRLVNGCQRKSGVGDTETPYT